MPADYNVIDVPPSVARAEAEILRTYRNKVSVRKKAKSLIKFGKHTLATGGTEETVSAGLGNEAYIFDNLIDTVSSSDAGDTISIGIEGHTITGGESNPVYTFVTQTATLNGQNKVTLDTPLARCSRIFNANGTELAGTVYAYQDTAITSGVPNDLTLCHCIIPIGFNQSFKAATTISDQDYLIITSTEFSVSRGGASDAAVDFLVEVRRPAGVFRATLEGTVTKQAGTIAIPIDPCLIIPRNSDIRIQANSSANSTPVRAVFSGYLASITQEDL